MASRGEARFPRAEQRRLPAMGRRARGRPTPSLYGSRTPGIFPLVANNSPARTRSTAPARRLVDGITAVLPPLRNNLGALTTLLAIGLLLLLALSLADPVAAQGPRRAVDRPRHDLRHQIHRQMYRLGQSSLPTEGVGPVVNLFTREVNDVRDGAARRPRRHAPDAMSWASACSSSPCSPRRS